MNIEQGMLNDEGHNIDLSSIFLPALQGEAGWGQIFAAVQRMLTSPVLSSEERNEALADAMMQVFWVTFQPAIAGSSGHNNNKRSRYLVGPLDDPEVKDFLKTVPPRSA